MEQSDPSLVPTVNFNEKFAVTASLSYIKLIQIVKSSNTFLSQEKRSVLALQNPTEQTITLIVELLVVWYENLRRLVDCSDFCKKNRSFLISMFHFVFLKRLTRCLFLLVIENRNLLFFSVQFQYWKDDILQWDPQNYSGIDQLVIPRKQIWVPSIMPINV